MCVKPLSITTVGVRQGLHPVEMSLHNANLGDSNRQPRGGEIRSSLHSGYTAFMGAINTALLTCYMTRSTLVQIRSFQRLLPYFIAKSPAK